jgi:hypothetical protein
MHAYSKARDLVMDKFPFDNDPARPGDFLGKATTKSKRWLISYWGGASLIFGYHSFIFLGLDNLNIASVQLTGGGGNVGWGAKKLGRTKRQAELLDMGEKGLNNYASETSRGDLAEAANSPEALYRAMMDDSIPHYVTARVPFSLDDVGKAWGLVEGFNADIYIAGAQMYWLTMHNEKSFLMSSKKYLARQRLANLGGGGFGAGIGNLFGQFTVLRYHSLYHSLGQSHDINARPYRTVPSVHPYLAELPPANASLTAPQSALERLNLMSGAQ